MPTTYIHFNNKQKSKSTHNNERHGTLFLSFFSRSFRSKGDLPILRAYDGEVNEIHRTREIERERESEPESALRARQINANSE